MDDATEEDRTLCMQRERNPDLVGFSLWFASEVITVVMRPNVEDIRNENRIKGGDIS
jgi:hypothetical protein